MIAIGQIRKGSGDSIRIDQGPRNGMWRCIYKSRSRMDAQDDSEWLGYDAIEKDYPTVLAGREAELEEERFHEDEEAPPPSRTRSSSFARARRRSSTSRSISAGRPRGSSFPFGGHMNDPGAPLRIQGKAVLLTKAPSGAPFVLDGSAWFYILLVEDTDETVAPKDKVLKRYCLGPFVTEAQALSQGNEAARALVVELERACGGFSVDMTKEVEA